MNKFLNYGLGIFILILTGLGYYYFDTLTNLSDQIADRDNVFMVGKVTSPFENENNFNQASSSNESVSYEIIEIANGLFVPWSIAFTSENRFLITERNGNIREVVDDVLGKNLLIKFNDVKTSSEEGLMGLAVDPGYQSNKYLYTCYAYSKNGSLKDKVVRLIDNETSIEVDKIILDDIPAASNHAGCRVKFGPDEKLYITTGDATNKDIAQDMDSLGGKILRINKDGSFPNDNYFENSAVYTLGHRNPQGIDWTENGLLIESEHGPSGFDGPPGGDEINKIMAGANYGWPIVSHEKTDPKYISPLRVFTPAIAPGSLMVYKSDLFPQFKGNIFIGGLKGEGLYMITFENSSYDKVKEVVKVSEVNFGRIREVVESPVGEIYFTTSNRDGRGTLRSNDDKIYKISLKND